MLSVILSRIVILGGGALYPAYRSYKTVKTKNVRDYVKWMMYWIVFAIFLCVEAFIDLFFSFWFPFYYETKILFVVWLLSPYTKGASFIYRKLIHPMLMKHEQEIDEYLDKAKLSSYRTFTNFLARAVAHLKQMVIEAAVHGQEQFIIQMRKSSLFSEVGDLDALEEKETLMNESKKSKASKKSTNQNEDDPSERVWEGYYAPDSTKVEREKPAAPSGGSKTEGTTVVTRQMTHKTTTATVASSRQHQRRSGDTSSPYGTITRKGVTNSGAMTRSASGVS